MGRPQHSKGTCYKREIVSTGSCPAGSDPDTWRAQMKILKDFSGESGEAQTKVLKILPPLALPLMNIDVALRLCHSFCFGAFLIF